MEDVNVAADVVLCRSCHWIGKFSDMVQENEDGSVLDQVPARLKVVKTARGLEMTYRRSKAAGIAMLLFTLFWNGVTYGFLFSMLGSNDHEMSGYLFISVFMLLGFGAFLFTMYVLFGCMKLTLNPGKGELFRGVCGVGRRQPFLLVKDACISIEESGMQEDSRRLFKIVVTQPVGKSLEFGTSIVEDDARRYVAALLRQMRT